MGCFVTGYSLIVPKNHRGSLAEASGDELARILGFAEHVRAAIFDEFGPTIIAEHGSGAPDEPTAACCVHSHLHLIPVKTQCSDVVAEYVARGGPGRPISPVEDLPPLAGHSYLTLSTAPGEWVLWHDASRFPRQFVRRAVATALGDPGMFDWRLSPFPEKMLATSMLLKQVLGGRR